MKKSCHGRLQEDIFHVAYVSYGLILFCETSKKCTQAETKRKHSYLAFFYQDSCSLKNPVAWHSSQSI